MHEPEGTAGAGETVARPGTAYDHGAGPANLVAPSANVQVDANSARHAVINSQADSVHSGFIAAAPQERIGLAQAPLGVTRFRAIFTHPGVFNYLCALHAELAMVGKVIVLP